MVIEDGKVLMMQEAKPSCRGQWCLPVGTVNRKESLVVRSWTSKTINVTCYVYSKNMSIVS